MRKPEVNTPVEKRFATIARKTLEVNIGENVTVEFTKRDGERRTLVGRVEAIKGTGDKEVVIIETAEGFRSANLTRINKWVRKA